MFLTWQLMKVKKKVSDAIMLKASFNDKPAAVEKAYVFQI